MSDYPGAYSTCALKVGNLEVTALPELIVEVAELTRQDKTEEFEGANNPGTQIAPTGEMAGLKAKYFFKTVNLTAMYELFRAEESRENLTERGGERVILHNPFENSFVPSTEKPLRAFMAHVPPLVEGGQMNAAARLETEYKASGAVEMLTDLPTTPANFASDGNPTADTITLQWDAVAGNLVKRSAQIRVVSFDVYRANTSGGPYTKVNTTPINNPGTGTVTFPDTGLDPSTIYYYVAVSKDFFGLQSVYSTEVSETTTA